MNRDYAIPGPGAKGRFAHAPPLRQLTIRQRYGGPARRVRANPLRANLLRENLLQTGYQYDRAA